MLALATHEPHFCIIREKVIMRRRAAKVSAVAAHGRALMASVKRRCVCLSAARGHNVTPLALGYHLSSSGSQ